MAMAQALVSAISRELSANSITPVITPARRSSALPNIIDPPPPPSNTTPTITNTTANVNQALKRLEFTKNKLLLSLLTLIMWLSNV